LVGAGLEARMGRLIVFLTGCVVGAAVMAAEWFRHQLE
jgi:hypothetical protein